YLMTRAEVAALGIHSERRESLRGPELDFDLPPLAVMCALARPVPDNILVAQLHADLRGDIRELVEVLHRERPAAGHVRQGIQERGPVAFFRGRSAVLLEQPDRIDLHI